MNQTLPEVITGILTHNGAIVERQEDGSLEVIMPPEVSRELNIPEYARLSFSCAEAGDEIIYASYDSEFFVSLKNLFTGRGGFTVASFEPSLPNIEKTSRLIQEKIAFRNATFRLDRTITSDLSYFLIFFKYIALSDEKHEGILPVLINGLNLSSISLESKASELMGDLKEPDPVQKPSPAPFHRLDNPPIGSYKNGEGGEPKVFLAAHNSAVHTVEERMKDFIRSLERRLNRDVKRVFEYYETLKNETRNIIERKVISKEPTGTNSHPSPPPFNSLPIEGGGKGWGWGEGKGEEDFQVDKNRIDKLMHKLNAIETERKWKIQDLIAKYTLNIQIEPVVVIRIETKASMFWINIKRRLASREFPVTYNPIVRQFDPLPCESCFNPHEGYYICDDQLHIVCGHCFNKICLSCGKQYCRACYKNKCPKCKKGSQ